MQVLREKAGEKGRNPYYGNGVVKMHKRLVGTPQ